MRKLAAIYSGLVVGLVSLTAISGCGASGSNGGCGGRSRSVFTGSDLSEMAGRSRRVLPMPFVQEATFDFSERSGKAKRFKASTGLSGFPTVYRAVSDEPGTAPSEIITVGTSGTPCGPTPDWYLSVNVSEGRAAVGGRLQAGHSYPIVSGSSTPDAYAKVRIFGGNGAGEFLALVGGVTVEAADEKKVDLRLTDLVFQHVGGDGKPDAGGLFKLNGVIRMATMN